MPEELTDGLTDGLFKKYDLSCATLRGEFHRCKFEYADLAYLDAMGAAFNACVFNVCDMLEANFSGAKFEYCVFRGCMGRFANFEDCSFVGCTFESNYFRDAHLPKGQEYNSLVLGATWT